MANQADGVPARMRAAYVEELGPPEAIRVGELPTPTPGPDEVLVAVEVVVVNPVDAHIRAGRFRTPMPMPFVIGRDLAGTVAAADEAATGFRVGERVWCASLGHGGRQGSFAQYAVAPADRLYRLADGVAPRLATAVAHPAATAYLGLVRHARLRPGETVFVGGAAGNVGTAAVQIATLAGARVVATARPADHDRVRAAGASAVFDYRDPDLAGRVADAARGGVHVFWETSGAHDFDVVARTAAPGCRVLVTAARGPAWVPLPQLYPADVSLLGFVVSRASVADLAAAAGLINQMLVAGALTSRIADEWPLERAALAHERMERGEISGRLLLRP